MSELNSEYDPFAAVYDRFWGRDYHLQVWPVLQQLLLSSIKRKAAILDVGCGNGLFTDRVQQGGFAVTGIDASEQMLNYARVNAPRSNFFLADVRSFDIGDSKFDAAYSIYESLNHLRTIADLRVAFTQIRQQLTPAGLFLFDLLGEKAYIEHWNHTDAIVEDDLVCVTRFAFSTKKKAGACFFTVFDQADGWRRSDFILRQYCHDFGEVQAALEDAGFDNITLYNGEDLGMNSEFGYDRLFFLARRK